MTTNTAITATLAGTAYSLYGTVSATPSGTALAGQRVTLLPVRAGMGAKATMVTNFQGFYGLTDTDTNYRVQLSGGKANSSGLPYRYKVKTTAFNLTQGLLLNLRLPIVDLTVTVKNQAGKTLRGVKVSVPCTGTTVTLATNLTATGTSCGLATTNARGVAKLGLLPTSTVSITATPKPPYQPKILTGVAADNSLSLTIVVPG